MRERLRYLAALPCPYFAFLVALVVFFLLSRVE